jgi:hypothetical protein
MYAGRRGDSYNEEDLHVFEILLTTLVLQKLTQNHVHILCSNQYKLHNLFFKWMTSIVCFINDQNNENQSNTRSVGLYSHYFG